MRVPYIDDILIAEQQEELPARARMWLDDEVDGGTGGLSASFIKNVYTRRMSQLETLTAPFVCPRCSVSDTRRSRRRAADFVSRLFGLRPYRCESCDCRFYRKPKHRSAHV
jgi:hypothetical protein